MWVGMVWGMETTTNTTTFTSQFGIKAHAQIQQLDGRTVEFQPEHLFCDDCWESADSGYSHATIFGSCFAATQHGWDDKSGHGIHVTVKR